MPVMAQLDQDAKSPSPPIAGAPVGKVIIFGLGQIASMAWYVLTHDSQYRVVAFTVDEAYLTCVSLHGLPVVPFEKLAALFPPEECGLHLPIGWKGMNSLRAKKLAQGRAMGYTIVSYVSARAYLWPDLRWGENCEIHQAVSIGPFVRIGENCLVFGSSVVGHHTVIGDHCYVAGRATVCGGAAIGEYCVLGASCTILDGVRIAPRCFIGAGALVNRDTQENGVYTGVPAKRGKLPADGLPIVR
jgi:sugar O-acyltransferase (sialic acid O-acetyltransferase NeuD family)